MKKPKNNNSWIPSPKNIKNALVAFIMLAGILLVLHKLTELGRNVQVISYSVFLEKIDQDLVKKVYVSEQDVEGIFTDGNRFETVIGSNANDWDRLRLHGVEFSIISPTNQIGIWYLFLFSGLFVESRRCFGVEIRAGGIDRLRIQVQHRGLRRGLRSLHSLVGGDLDVFSYLLLDHIDGFFRQDTGIDDQRTSSEERVT